MMIPNKLHNNGIKTVLKFSTMMVLKSFKKLKSSLMMLQKMFLNDGTKKVL